MISTMLKVAWDTRLWGHSFGTSALLDLDVISVLAVYLTVFSALPIGDRRAELMAINWSMTKKGTERKDF